MSSGKSLKLKKIKRRKNIIHKRVKKNKISIKKESNISEYKNSLINLKTNDFKIEGDINDFLKIQRQNEIQFIQ